MAKPVTIQALKEVNLFLNSSGKFEGAPKTIAALAGLAPGIDTVWVKFHNTIETNTESAIQVWPKQKQFTYIAKHATRAKKNKEFKSFVNFLIDLGFVQV